jgi:hypothetical protein
MCLIRICFDWYDPRSTMFSKILCFGEFVHIHYCWFHSFLVVFHLLHLKISWHVFLIFIIVNGVKVCIFLKNLKFFVQGFMDFRRTWVRKSHFQTQISPKVDFRRVLFRKFLGIYIHYSETPHIYTFGSSLQTKFFQNFLVWSPVVLVFFYTQKYFMNSVVYFVSSNLA